MPKDVIRTHVVGLTVDTAKHFTIPIETLFKCLHFLFIKQHKLWNDVQLRIPAVTCFGNQLSSAGTLLQLQLFSNFVIYSRILSTCYL